MTSTTPVAKWLRNHLSSVQHEQFDLFAKTLLAQRKTAGLTSLGDRQSIERRHFLESIALMRALTDHGVFDSPVIDIGTGAGIPGLPLKIAKPDIEITLVEATGKKVRFLEETVRALGLRGVSVIQARAEELAHDPSHRSAYALAVARAVAPLRVLVELALPFVRLGGCLAAPKGSGAERETPEAENALAVCGGRVELVEPLAVPPPGPRPLLVVVRKTSETPSRYPRRPGIPAKRPL